VRRSRARGRRPFAPDRIGVAAIAFDLDHFKEVNDTWGHDIGDRVLAHFGHVLGEQARSNDLVARTGGEEFVAVLPRSSVTEARVFAERVRVEFSRSANADIPSVTASAGVAATESPSNLDDLFIAADAALYAAKQSGRDRTIVTETVVAGR
jgi:diguanylate cyclase (GGDEF)-like protein